MPIVIRRTGSQLVIWTRLVVAGIVAFCPAVVPDDASASDATGTVLMYETFAAQTDPPNFGFPIGASISNGVLNVTQGMKNYTTSVRPLSASILTERTLDLRFDWKTAITSDAMKTGVEFRDGNGHLVFAIAATASELRYAVAGPDSASTSAPDSLNPTWIRTSFDRTKWYTVDLHLTLRRIQYTITSKGTSPRVIASATATITGTNLARVVACNYYGSGVQSIDNFRLTRPAYAANGSLAGSSVYAFGDSIVYGHQYPRSFVNLVAEREKMTLTKYARNGATIGPSTASGGQIITQVRNASTVSPAFVVFDGGTNDAIEIHDQHTYVIGVVSPSQDPATFDTRTYAGSLEATIYAMKQKWPAAQIVYVAVHKLGSRDWDTQLPLRQVTLQAAQKWNVVVADVFADTTLDTRVDAQRVAYTFDSLVNGFPGTGGTGTHPNLGGMTEFYVPVLTGALLRRSATA
ncbi:MAG: SGNH/GDSL hydrolase family protein [Hamadaea sp.]|uniref:SGNH/GDSL hydrolase family protein n=1 Tax=Hamadaea sp. TaxID=2024425 RepID=UPI0017CB0D13|nr:SGNH/GDSL hydrolase family protein [Hamadaea sp.]NUT18820.1 SGNH/GDSL hydrolase family protein [Hamadaea sp.]